MNGRIMHALLADDQKVNGPVTDMISKSIQFNESCENYRCLCNCFHIKTGALIVAGNFFFFSVQITKYRNYHKNNS